jgi:hypothetical protein
LEIFELTKTFPKEEKYSWFSRFLCGNYCHSRLSGISEIYTKIYQKDSGQAGMTAIGIAFIKSIVNLYLQVSMKNEKYNEVGKKKEELWKKNFIY